MFHGLERTDRSVELPAFFCILDGLIERFGGGFPTYIAGFVPGPLVQIRNLMLGARRGVERGA